MEMMGQMFSTFTQEHVQMLEKAMFSDTKTRVDAENLREAMEYSLKAGGKRFRPMLFLAVCKILQGYINTDMVHLAGALEMVHTYSLIHDDLPAMDNDDLRRGKPTNHKVFGEAMAILAGDGLLTLAFELTADYSDNAQMIKRLAKLAGVGTQGMVAGQVLDIEGEGEQLSLLELQNIHRKKTGGLIRYAVEGALLYLEQHSEHLLVFADKIGMAFQIRDDILDVSETTEELGKTAGKDVEMKKSTYPALLGLSGAYKALDKEVEHAKNALTMAKKEFPKKDFSVLDSLLEQFA